MLVDDDYLSSQDGTARFDLTTNMVRVPLEDPLNVNELDYQATHVHENSHWARLNGSTIGGTLSYLRFASQELIAQAFRELTASERSALAEQRRSGTPILRARDYSVTGSHNLQVIRQIWRDQFLTYKLLLDSELVQDLPWDPAAGLNAAMEDVLMHAEQVLQPGVTGEAGRLDLLDEREPVGVLRLGGTDASRLTTRHLLECTATIDQFFALTAAREHRGAGDAAEKVWSVLTLTSYGLPVRLYLALAPEPSSNSPWRMASVMSTVTALADLALNPPLPPYASVRSSTRSWQSLYPPLRFLVGAQASVREVGLLSPMPDNAEVLDYIDRLCRACGWENPQDYDGVVPRLASGGSLNLGPSPHQSPAVGLEMYIRFLSEVQCDLWNLRGSDPTALVHYGNGFGWRIGQGPTLEESGRTPFLLAPFWWTAGDRYQTRTPPGAIVSTHYLFSLLHASLLTQAATATGPARSGPVPLPAAISHRWPEVQDSVEQMLGISLW